MKLHLPSGLRKALLSCLAALAVALPSTVSSGAAFLGSGALVSFLLSHHAAAIDLNGDGIDDEDDEDDEVSPTAGSFGPEVTGDWVQVSGATLGTADGNYEARYAGSGNASLSGGTENSILKVVKYGSANAITFNQGELTAGTVWFTSEATGGQNWITITAASFLSASINDIYADGAALWLNVAPSATLGANFHFGTSNAMAAGWKFNDNTDLHHYISSNVTTTGNIYAVDGLSLGIGATFTAGQLIGDGDFYLANGLESNTTASLVLTSGGELGGELVFHNSKTTRYATLKLSSGAVLAVAGLSSDTLNDTATVYGKIARNGDSGTATVKITGTGSTATNLVIEDGVLLELADGASQTFAGTTELSSVTMGASSTLTFEGTTTLSSATLGANSTLTFNGALNMAEDTSFTLAGGAKLTFAGGLADVATTASLQIGSSGGASELVFNNGSELDVKCDFSITSSDVTLVKQGNGMLVFGNGSNSGNDKLYTIGGDIDIKQGTVRFTGAADITGDVNIADGARLSFWKLYSDGGAVPEANRRRVVRGQVKGDGSLYVCDEAVDLLGGGKIGGNLITGWGTAVFRLGADLEVGGFGQDASNYLIRVEKSTMAGVANDDVCLVVNTKGNNVDFANYVTLGEYVNLGKKGSGVLTVSTSSKLGGGVVVWDGTLKMSEATCTLHDVTLKGGTLELVQSGTFDSFTVDAPAILKLSISGGIEEGDSFINIANSGAVTINGKLVIDLGDVFAWTDTEMHQLFEGVEWNSAWNDLIILQYTDARAGKKVVLDERGYLQLDDLVDARWQGSELDVQWSNDSTGGGWNPDYDDHANVTFDGRSVAEVDGEKQTVQVTLTEDISTTNLSIDNGNFTFSSSEGYTLRVDGNFKLQGYSAQNAQKDYTVTIDTALEVGGTLTVYGNGYLANQGGFGGAILTLNEGGRAGKLEAGYGAVVKLGADLQIGDFSGNDWRSFFYSTNDKQHYLTIDVSSGEKTLNTAHFGQLHFAQFEDGTYQVGIKKTGDGKLILSQDIGRIDTDIVVEKGLLWFGNNSGSRTATITIGGNLTVKNADGWSEMSSGIYFKFLERLAVEGYALFEGNLAHYNNTLEFQKGGKVTGNLIVGWSASIELGDDLEVGGLVGNGVGNADDGASVGISATRKSGVDDYVYLLLMGDGASSLTTDAFVQKYTSTITLLQTAAAGGAVGIGVSGGVWNFTESGTINYHFKNKNATISFADGTTIAGVMEFAGENGVINVDTALTVGALLGDHGSVKGTGTLTISGANAGTSASSGATFGEDVSLTLNWASGEQTLTSAFAGDSITVSNGTLVLSAGGTLGGALQVQSDDGTAELKLGANLSATYLSGVWGNGGQNSITSSADTTITLTLTGASGDAASGVGNTVFGATEHAGWGNLTIGSAEHRINLVKQGVYEQTFAGGSTFALYGDLAIEAGYVRFSGSSNGINATINGQVTRGNDATGGTLAVQGSGVANNSTGTKLTITGRDGSAGSIGTVNINGGTLELQANFSIDTLTFKTENNAAADGKLNLGNNVTLTVTNKVTTTGGTVYTWGSGSCVYYFAAGAEIDTIDYMNGIHMELGAGQTLSVSNVTSYGNELHIDVHDQDEAGSKTATFKVTQENNGLKGGLILGKGVNLESENADLLFGYHNSNVTFDLQGTVTLAGLTIQGNTSASATGYTNTTTFHKGATVTGNFTIGKGALVKLKDNVVFTGELSLASADSKLENLNDTGSVWLAFDTGKLAEEDPDEETPDEELDTVVSKTFAEMGAGAEITWGERTGVAKTGAKDLTITGSGELGGDFGVLQGFVEFNGTSFSMRGLTLADNTSLAVKAGTVDFGSAYSFGTGSSLEVNVASGSTAKLKVAEAFGSATNLSLKLSAGLDYLTEGWNFALFDLSGVTTWADKNAFVAGVLGALDQSTTGLLLRGLKYSLDINDDGVGTLSVVRDDSRVGLVHVVGEEETSFTWTSATPDDDSWLEDRSSNEGTYFMAGDDATIYGEGHTVAISVQTTGIEVHDLALENGTLNFAGGDLTITGNLTAGVEDVPGANEGDDPTVVSTRVSFSNAVSLGGDITLIGSGAELTFTGATTLSKTDAIISGAGSVTFNGLTTASGIVVGNGTDATTVEMNVVGMTAAASKNDLGMVEVKAGSSFVINAGGNGVNPNNASPFTTNTQVKGAGSLVLNITNSEGHFNNSTNPAIGGYPFSLIVSLLDRGTTDLRVGENSIHEVHITKEGSQTFGLHIGNDNDNTKRALGAIENLYIGDGLTLRVATNVLNTSTPLRDAEGNTVVNTLHIAGDGLGQTSNDGGAINFRDNATQMAWNVHLTGDASINSICNQANVTLNGAFMADGHAFTKLGGKSLTITKLGGYAEDGSVTAAKYVAGAVNVKAGTLVYNLEADSTIATTMTVDENTTLTLTGSGATATAPRVYTVQDMRGAGSVGTATNSGAATLRINTAELEADVENEDEFTLSGVGLSVSVNSSDTTSTRSYTISGATLTNLTELAVEKGNLILKNSDETAKAHTVAGKIDIASGATLQIADTLSDKITLTGTTLSGSGTLRMKTGTLTLSQGGTSGVVVDIRNDAEIVLGGTLTIGGLDNGAWEGRGTANISLATTYADDVKLILNVGEGIEHTYAGSAVQDDTKLVINENITLEKTGTGKQTLLNLTAGKVTLTAGTLAFNGTSEVTTQFTAVAGTLALAANGSLTLADYSGSLTKLVLGANSTLTVKASADASAINLVGAEFGSGSHLNLAGGAKIAIDATFNTAIQTSGFAITLTELLDLDMTDADAVGRWEYRLYDAVAGFDGVVNVLDDSMLRHGQRFLDTNGVITITGAALEHGDLEYRENDSFVWTEGDSTKRWLLTSGGLTGVADFFLADDNVTFIGGYESEAALEVSVDGAVNVGDLNITVGENAKGFVFSAYDEEGSKDGDKLYVHGDMQLSMGEDAKANFDVAVHFDKTDGTTIKGAGSVTFAEISGARHGLVVGDDEGHATTVTITGVGSNTHLGNLGAIEVKKGATVILDAMNSEGVRVSLNNITGTTDKSDHTDYFFGEGTVVLGGLSGTYTMTNRNSIMSRLLNASNDNGECITTLDTLQVGTDTSHISFVVNAYGQRLFTAFRSVKNLVFHEGSGLKIGWDGLGGTTSPLKYDHDKGYGKLSHTNTIHIIGTGNADTDDAALSVVGADSEVSFNLELDGDATVNVSHDSTITYKQAGAFIAKGHTLTKIGNGVMEIDLLGGYAEDGSVTAADYVAGEVKVAEGTLRYALGADATIATTVTLGDEDGEGDAVLELAGAGASASSAVVYTVSDIKGTGDVALQEDTGKATLRIQKTISANDTNNSNVTISDVGLAFNITVNGGSGYFIGTGITLNNLASLSVEKGTVSLNGTTPQGNTPVAAKSHSVAGGLSIAQGAVFNVGSGYTQLISLTVGGELSGGGVLSLVGSGDANTGRNTLTLNGGGTFDGVVSFRNSSYLALGQSLSIGGIDYQGWNGSNGDAKILLSDAATDDVTLTIDVADEQTTRRAQNSTGVTLTIEDNITLVKTGAGTQSFLNLAADAVEVQQGTLLFGVGNKDNDATFAVKSITVQGDGTLEITKTSWAGTAETLLTLKNDGELKLNYTGATAVSLGFGTLKLVADDATSDAGHITWSATATSGQTLTLGKLTGTGVLDAGLLSYTGGNDYRNLVLGSIENFNGTVDATVSDHTDSVTAGRGVLYLGSVTADATALAQRGNFHNDEGYASTITAAKVVTSGFRKTGAGSLDLQYMNVLEGGLLYMNYEGSLTMTGLHIGGSSTLYYTTGDTQVIEWELSDWRSSNWVEMDFDIWGALTEDPGIMLEGGSGLCLGIVADAADATDDIFSTLMGSDGTDGCLHLRNAAEGADFSYELSWEDWGDTGRKVLYLKVTGITRDNELLWDKNWLTELATAPDGEQMTRSQTRESDYANMSSMAGTFTQHALVLGNDTANRFNFGAQHRVRLVGGPEAGVTLATVVGGWLYTADSPVSGNVDRTNTYISLRAAADGTQLSEDTHYHLLVGGSVNASSADVAGSGFKGNTHIQMEGGTVDYIVGGNHLNTSAFSFEGNSYISVGSGQVTGGIVGGSTLVAGRSDDARTYYEFKGNSYIYIYNALSGNSPVNIGGGNIGFAAVVGGNAWIGAAGSAQELSPSFYGSSHINVDLTNPGVIPTGDDEATEGATGGDMLSFDKAIVGGNYTVYSTAVGEGASTLFEGRGTQRYASEIVITTGETAVTFTGGINGASRRDSAGAGTTRFEGDTNVVINGGIFDAEIAGGFWFAETATGSHSSELLGDTHVTVNGGQRVWRVVGGSVSLAGSGSSSTTTGDAYVTITGGVFGNKLGTGRLTQGDVGFVAGGDLYKNTGTGADHERVGSTHVDISGGSFNNIHIVGGDYANFSGSNGTSGPVINGSTEVLLGVGGAEGDVSITGLVVGGSYLTDMGSGGSVTINAGEGNTATRVVIGSGASIQAESGTSQHRDHRGVAVVAGHALVDEADEMLQAGGHTVSITGNTELEMQGGVVRGHLVGGSYTSNSEWGENSLITDGDSSIELAGGTVIGSVFGGHYSDNTVTADTLSMGAVNIHVDGTSVQGDIVGGARRAVMAGSLTSPTQGDIEITLDSGRLQGNVYAAGYHSSTNLQDFDLTVQTASTTVSISTDFEFGAVSDPTSGAAGALSEFIVSGGYKKATGNSAATDRSVVTGEARLNLTDARKAYEQFEHVSFRDFDVVNNVSDINMKSLTVMDRGTDTSFTKEGSGTLSVADGLHVEGSLAKSYTGSVSIEGGYLKVGADQQLNSGGLSFNMHGRLSGNVDSAYLQGVDGGLIDFGEVSESNQFTVSFSNADNLDVGTYYLVSGLLQEDILKGEKKFFVSDDVVVAENMSADVYVNGDGCLVLRVHYSASPDGEWVWDPEASNGEWGDNGHNFAVNDNDEYNEDHTIVFDNGAEFQDVHMSVTQNPGKVWVKSGDYTFSIKDGSDSEGFDMDGRIIVGGDLDKAGEYREAAAALNSANKKVGEVELRENGTLTIGHSDALQTGDDGTHIYFHGGLLAIAEANGALVFTDDLSWGVQAQEYEYTEGALNMVRIKVGKSSEEYAASAAAYARMARMARAAQDPMLIRMGVADDGTYATRENNEMVKQVFGVGVEQSGRGTLEIVWTEEGNQDLGGRVDVLDGTLRFLLHGVENSTGTVTLGTGGSVYITQGAVLELVIEGAGRLVLDRDLNVVEKPVADGDEPLQATLVLGSKDVQGTNTEQAAYGLARDNSSFAGVLELRGNGAESYGNEVQVSIDDALGGADTTLVINGMHLSFTGADAHVLGAGTVEVIDADHISYVGGHRFTTDNQRISITGSVKGSGVLGNADGGFEHSISGAVSEFTGTLVAGAGSTWTLTKNALSSGEVKADLAGNGTIIIGGGANDSSDVKLTGSVGSETWGNGTNLESKLTGGGKLIIANADNSSEGNLIFNGNEIQLGTEVVTIDDEGNRITSAVDGRWNGSVWLGSGTYTLVSGSTKALAYRDQTVSLVVNTAKNAVVNAGGTDGSDFTSITINEGGQLRGVRGQLRGTKLEFKLIDANMDDSDKYLIVMDEGSKGIYVNSLDEFGLTFTNSAFVDVLKRHMNEQTNLSYIHIVQNGSLAFRSTVDLSELMVHDKTKGLNVLLGLLGFTVQQADTSRPGDLQLLGSSNNVYLVIKEGEGGDSHTVNDYGRLSGFLATVVDENQTLDVTLGDLQSSVPDTAADSESYQKDIEAGGAVVNNLVGLNNSTFAAHKAKDATGDVTVVLDNSIVDPDELDSPDKYKDRIGVDTSFDGTIRGDEGVNFRKVGQGTLTVGTASSKKSGLQIEGDMTLADGGLVLNGGTNSMGSLTFDYSGDKTENKGLTLGEGSTTTVGSMVDATNGNEVRLQDESRLVLTGTSELDGTTFTGSGTLNVHGRSADVTLDGKGSYISGGVDVVLSDGGSLTLTNGSSLTDGNLSVTDGSLTLSNGSKVSGKGDVSLGKNGKAALSGGSTMDVDGKLTLAAGSSMSVEDAASAVVARGGAVVDGKLDLGASKGSQLTGLSGSGTIAGDGASLKLLGDSSFDGSFSGSGIITIEQGSSLTLNHVNQGGDWTVVNEGSLTLDITGLRDSASFKKLHMERDSQTTLLLNTDQGRSMGGVDLDEMTWTAGAKMTIRSTGTGTFDGDRLDLGMLAKELQEGKQPTITMAGAALLHYQADKLYQEDGHLYLGVEAVQNNLFYTENMHKNAMAGADMFWDVSSPNSRFWRELAADPFAVFKSDLYKVYAAMADMVVDGQHAQLERTLAAGAGASVAVLGSALSQDIQRQLKTMRTRTTNMGGELADGKPLYHVWLNAEGSYHKLDAEGLAPGYTLNSWGGTVGVEFDLSAETTVGLALSAMYGDLKTDSADSGRGNLDTTYLSGFARTARGSWMHTFVVSAGLADVSLSRTVNYGVGSYSTTGNTNGYALGLLYELGYSQVMNSEGTLVLQPVFNVELKRSVINGYTEGGSDAGLKVGDIEQNVVTFGLGTRMQQVVGANSLNRSAVFEARALLKADLGDRSGKADNRLIKGSVTREVESAEVGAVGVELGAGLNIPVSSGSSIFIDASIEFRKGYTSMDANVGYRASF